MTHHNFLEELVKLRRMLMCTSGNEICSISLKMILSVDMSIVVSATGGTPNMGCGGGQICEIVSGSYLDIQLCHFTV